MAKNKPHNKPITEWKRRLVSQDIESYWLGQITLKQIAKNRNVSYQIVISIQSSLMSKRLMDSKIPR